MKILGINDEVTTCECCGRTNLKKTVVLTNGEGEVHYGVACAAAAMGRKQSSVKAEAISAVVMSYERAVNAFQWALNSYCKEKGIHVSVAYAHRREFAATELGQKLADEITRTKENWKRASA